MNLDELKLIVDATEAKIDELRYEVAQRVRETILVPFCDKHQLNYKAGNGSWVVYNDTWDLWEWHDRICEDEVPEGWFELKDALDMEIEEKPIALWVDDYVEYE